MRDKTDTELDKDGSGGHTIELVQTSDWASPILNPIMAELGFVGIPDGW